MAPKKTFEEKKALALSGSVEDLSGLMTEHNPGIISNMLANPNMTAALAIQLIRRKHVTENHIIAISANRKWQKNYYLKLELVLHPSTPRNISLKYLQDMFLRDLAVISRRVTLHPILRESAVNYLKLKLESMRAGEKIMLARSGPVAFLHSLMEDKDSRILKAALSNYRLTEEELLQFAIPSKRTSEKLDIILHDDKWGNNPQVIRILASHKNLGYAARRLVFEKLHLPQLLEQTESPALKTEHRNLARFVARERIRSMSVRDLVQLCGTHSSKLLYYIGITLEDSRVAAVWLKNPLVKTELMREAMRKTGNQDIRSLLENALKAKSKGLKPDNAQE
jgi:hypothetical protein